MSLLELEQVVKEYPMGGESVYALNGVDLTIESGDYLAILGPSGSGKSTLMHLLGFMDRPTQGSIRFDGQEVSSISPAKRAWYRANRLGFVFQSFNLLPRLSVVDNVLLPATYARSERPATKGDAMVALERVGMGHRAGHRPGQLSGGERQRVAIARALINKPRLILADEPTGNLDSENVAKTIELFEELVTEGQTFVMVTHDLNVAEHARRVVHMLDGKVRKETRR
jgi:putative ABC transport system ATP-binding protein